MDLAMLNRLRVNAGKPELRSWKASKQKLIEAITKLQDEGFLDTLPGANVNAPPVTDDPELTIGPAEAHWVTMHVRLPYEAAQKTGAGSHAIQFEIERLASSVDATAVKLEEKSTFMVPR